MTTSNKSRNETIALIDGRVLVLRAGGGLDPTTDTVLLAAACQARKGERVLDLGCGTGAAGLCVLVRTAGTSLVGIDIQPNLVELARRGAAANGLHARARFDRGDIRSFRPNKEDRFDHVICNPPYLEEGAHTPSPDGVRAMAIGGGAEIKDWIDAAFHALKPHGSLTLIHRADMLDKAISALGKRFGAVELIPVWPAAGKPASRIFLRARKDRRSPALLHPGLVLHEKGRRHTPEAEKILREGGPL